MKYTARMLAVAVMMMPLLATAQGTHKIVAQVPFEFMAGNHLMPAGKVVVETTDNYGNFLLIHSDAGTTTYSIVSLSEAQEGASVTELVFNKYGDRYFLAGMKLGTSQSIYWLPRGKAENELRAQNVPSTEEVLLASRK